MNSDQRPFDSDKKLNERLDVDFALQAAGLGVWEVDPVTNQVLWDNQCRQLFGLAAHNQLPYQQAIQYIHTQDRDRVNQAVQWAMNPQSDGVYDQTYRTLGADDGQLRWVRFFGRSYFTPAGKLSRFAGVAQDVTQQVLSRQKLEESEQTLHALIDNAPAATCISLFLGRELIIHTPNQAFIDTLGKGNDIAGKPLREIMPELEDQPYLDLLDQVYTTGQPHQSFGTPATIVQQGVPVIQYFNASFTALRDAKGHVYGILNISVNVTSQVLAQQEEEESQRQRQLLALFEQSPVGLAIYSADDTFVIQWANTFYGQLVDRPLQAVTGKPLLEALPELKGQGFDEILRNVIATGIPFTASEQRVEILRNAQLTTIYVDLTYQPRKGPQGYIESILMVATDVTEQVLTRREIELNEQILREMVVEAPIGICLLNASDLVAESVNDAFLEVAGRPYEIIMGKHYWKAFPETAPYYEEALNQVVKTGESFYANEVELMLIRHGKEEVIYVTFAFVPLKNAVGTVMKVAVWVLENTFQVTERQKVENLVQQRTGELSIANEELAAMNEELAAMNEELATSNDDLLISSEKTVAVNEQLAQSNYNLSRSNDNLEKFAYIASHDLQEPLRKIQQFSDILKMQHADQLGEGVLYLERMQSAASRMSTLIRDLLTYSRISTQQNAASSVPLDQVVTIILDDLELRIKETGAVVEVDVLPVIPGDRLQLEQLFQNLLSNALKFHRDGASPVVHVGYQRIPHYKLPELVKPTQKASYYHKIDVTDNGVGFDEKYLDRIFQVFQRLHGKNEFAGTGIGLAICEKVVANHGGAITATSQPGQGATFTIYFPAQLKRGTF